jgi:acid phosphatase
MSWGALIGIIVAITAALYSTCQISILPLYSICPTLCPSACSHRARNFDDGYAKYDTADKPHHSSWNSWWHPQLSDGTLAEHKLGAGAITRDWNILYHLGGNGPWVEKVLDVLDEHIAPPESCEVVQVHMVRHAHGTPDF